MSSASIILLYMSLTSKIAARLSSTTCRAKKVPNDGAHQGKKVLRDGGKQKSNKEHIVGSEKRVASRRNTSKIKKKTNLSRKKREKDSVLKKEKQFLREGKCTASSGKVADAFRQIQTQEE